MKFTALRTLVLLVATVYGFASTAQPQETATSSYDPPWASIAPIRVLRNSKPDGEALTKAVSELKPGDQLELAEGVYSISRLWDIGCSGTEKAPIRIVAAKGAKVVITRPDAKQNVINLGQAKPVQYLCIAGLEITGGSHGLRIGECSNIWIDRCHIHHTGEVCLSANSAATHRLYLTRNHIHDGGGHAEGMYLGANDGKFVMSESIIALNHIHDCRGDQGDGIEVKQGSWGNLIAENHVHDTNYPCVTVYGTAGKPVNIIERNLCYRSNDHVMQVQGEAIVRNNVLVSAKGSGLSSTDHQGKTENLQVIHNTIINEGHAFSGRSWNDRMGMVIANNVLYSHSGNPLHFAQGSEGVLIRGNVVLGNGNKFGSPLGRGLEDFVGISWDGQSHDATPLTSAPLDRADREYMIQTDFFGKPRNRPTSGAIGR